MIDKSIRADYDIKNRRRYFTGAFGGAGAGRGRDPSPSGPPGGGDRQMTYSAPAPSPHRDDSAERAAQAVADALNAQRAAAAQKAEDEAREAARERAIQEAAKPINVITTAKAPPSILAREVKPSMLGDTGDGLEPRDWEFEDKKVQVPTTFKPKTITYDRHVPFTDDPVKIAMQQKYSPTYYQDRSKIGGETWGERAEAEIPRGGIMSAIGGGLKKIGKTIFGDNPFDIAMNVLTFSGWKQAKYAKMLLNARKEGSISNKTWKKAKDIGNKLLDKKDAQKKAAKKLVKDKDGIATQIAKGTGLESGAELLGLKKRDDLSDIKEHRADLSANDIKLINWAKNQGMDTPTKIRETVGASFNKKESPTDAEIKGVLEGTITKPTGIFAAHGGRIDGPLTGGSRYI